MSVPKEKLEQVAYEMHVIYHKLHVPLWRISRLCALRRSSAQCSPFGYRNYPIWKFITAKKSQHWLAGRPPRPGWFDTFQNWRESNDILGQFGHIPKRSAAECDQPTSFQRGRTE